VLIVDDEKHTREGLRAALEAFRKLSETPIMVRPSVPAKEKA
jgi:DNA-binding NarL/FixJ family response regulator